jgi:malonate-semialdehyde dehydrogenase (acetylating)/methylmalonate-semialdehyde dehydrogenase
MLLKGEYTDGAGPGIDVYSMRQPLGVVAGITPFNFPAMIPMWMFGARHRCGNTFILKPSERDPSRAGAAGRADHGSGRLPCRRAQRRARRQGGGRRDPDHPGSRRSASSARPTIAHYIYHRRAHGKRVQAMGGAKNHGSSARRRHGPGGRSDLIGAAFGSAGERCMALPVAVPVGQKTADELREKLIPPRSRR